MSKYDRPILAGFPMRQLQALLVAAKAGKGAAPKGERVSLAWAIRRLEEARDWALKQAQGGDHE